MIEGVVRVTAEGLRAGDVLAPDDSRVLMVERESGDVMVKVKAPRNRAAWYRLPPEWPLLRREK